MDYTEVNRTSSPKRRNRLLICLCVVLMVIVILSVTLGLTLGTSSPVTLKTNFTNRCQTFLKDNAATTSQNNCENMWESFKQAFVERNSCDVLPEAYDSLFHTVSKEPTCNRMLFWSQTKEIAHAFTKKTRCYLTLEDTLLGYILNEQTWCGREDSNETFTTGCPEWLDCDNNPVRSFWKRASAELAAAACGDVFVMLNGSKDESFNRLSIFASVEVKRFNYSIMNGLTVLLVTKETDTKTCESDASLKDLQTQLDPKLKYTCKIVPQSKIQNCISQITCDDCW